MQATVRSLVLDHCNGIKNPNDCTCLGGGCQGRRDVLGVPKTNISDHRDSFVINHAKDFASVSMALGMENLKSPWAAYFTAGVYLTTML